MPSKGERLKMLRKALNINQSDFAKKISTTQGHISGIENGRKNLPDRTIKLICLENWDGKIVNETWLRTGEGEMFIQAPEKDETSILFLELLQSDKNEFYTLITNIIHTYKSLSPSSQKALTEFSIKLSQNLQKKNED